MEEYFKLGNELSDYGKLLFEYDDTKSEIFVSREKRKALSRSPWFYCGILVILIMVAWFIASFISSCMLDGEEIAHGILLNLSGLIPFAVFTLIIVITIKAMWGKFGFATDGFAENSLRIYENYFVITEGRKVDVYNISQVKYVDLEWKHFIRFVSYDNQIVEFHIEIPHNATTANDLARIFGKKITTSNSNWNTEVITCDRSLGAMIFLTLFTLMPIGLGIGLIFMHYQLGNVPLFIGAFFICFGAIALMGVYSFIPFIKDVLVPFCFGGCFTVFPFWLVSTIWREYGFEVDVHTYTTFNLFTCTAFCFALIGLLLIFTAIRTVIQYILYGHKLRTRKMK